jgi:hypothetical protein
MNATILKIAARPGRPRVDLDPWGMPNLNILSGGARPGLPTTAAHQNFGGVMCAPGAMRQLQLGLKYSF